MYIQFKLNFGYKCYFAFQVPQHGKESLTCLPSPSERFNIKCDHPSKTLLIALPYQPYTSALAVALRHTISTQVASHRSSPLVRQVQFRFFSLQEDRLSSIFQFRFLITFRSAQESLLFIHPKQAFLHCGSLTQTEIL